MNSLRVRDYAGILSVFVRKPEPEFYRTSPGMPDRTGNAFYRIHVLVVSKAEDPDSCTAWSTAVLRAENSVIDA